MLRQKSFLFFCIFLTLIISVFSIIYYPSESLFEAELIKINQGEDFTYSVDISLKNLIPEPIDYDVEIIYLEENLVVSNRKVKCSTNCEENFGISKTFFGEYKIVITSRFQGNFYRKEIFFDLQYNPQSYSISHEKIIELDPLNGINLDLKIDSTFTEKNTYKFEIFPKTSPETIQTFTRSCKGSCDLSLNINSKIVIDDYVINVYSPQGDFQSEFTLVLPYIQNLPPKKKRILRKNFKNYFEAGSEDKLTDYFFYTNLSKDNYDVKVKFKKNKRNIRKEFLREKDIVDIEFEFNDTKIKSLKVPNAIVDNVSIGFEKVPKEEIEEDFVNETIVNSFAIDPKVNDEVEYYELNFVATGTELFKCEQYDFDNRICFGNYTKILDTVPGQEYSLNLTPKDPIFVEIVEGEYNVQRGLVTGTTTSFTNTIEEVNTAESFILKRQRSASSSSPNSWQTTPFFSTNTSVSFDRYATTSNTAVDFEIISSNLFTVQSGSEVLSASTAGVDVTINPVNLGETFAIAYGRCNSGTTSHSNSGYFFANLTNSTNLRLERGNAANCEGTVRWQVVQYQGATVQSGSANFDSALTTVSDAISTVDTEKAFLIFGWSSVGSDPGMNSNLIRGTISSSTQVSFSRTGADGTSDRDIVYYVIEHEDLNVDSYQTSITGDSTQSISVTNTSRAFLVTSDANSGGGQTYRNSHFTMNMSSNTTVDVDKETTSQTITANWFTVEFLDSGEFNISAQVTINSTSGFGLLEDNLTCNYELGSDATTAFINFIRGDNSITNAAYPFEGNSSNALIDYSNNSNDGTNVGATWISNSGYDANGSFIFDGENDFIDIADNSLLDITNQITIMAWARMDGQSADNDFPRIVSKGQSTATNGAYGIWVSDPSTSSIGCRLIDSGVARDATTTSGIENDNGWHHYACTYDGTTIRLYVDGTEVDTNVVSFTIDSTSDNLTIGTGNDERHFNGSIDDVRIYNTSLSSNQINMVVDNRSNEIHSDYTFGDEIWMCQAIPFNTAAAGPFYPSSNDVTIIGAIPVTNISVVSPTDNPQTVYQNAPYNIELNISCIDTEDCNNVDVTLLYEGRTVIGESGSVTLSNNNQVLIPFTKSYAQTPIFLGVPATNTDNDENPLVPVVHSINTTHVNVSLCEDTGGTTCDTGAESEDLHYMVFDIDETDSLSWIDVGTINSITTNGADNAFSFGQTFSNTPYVFVQSQTYNAGGNAIGPHAWFSAVSTSGGTIVGCDHPGIGDTCAGTASENFGYVAIDFVNADIPNVNNGSESIGDSTWTPVTYTNTLTNPIIMVAQNSETGAQDPQYPWARSITGTGADVRYCEADASGVCNTHNPETVVWMSLEEGLIEISTVIQAQVSSPNYALPLYTPASNPQNIDINSSDSRLVSFPLIATGTVGNSYELYATVTYGNASNTFNITIDQSFMSIDLTLPLNNTAVIANETFTINANMTCIGDCGNISVFSRANETNINETFGTVPFYTPSFQPQTCIPGINGSCAFAWTVNATGDINTYHLIDALFTSTVLGSSDTFDSLVQIISGPEIYFTDSTMSISGVLANYQSASNTTTIETLLVNHTDVNVTCESGDCALFSTNFTNGATLNAATFTGIEFTCAATDEGTFSALFSIVSNEDTSQNIINVSCIATELPLFVNLVDPDTSLQYDLTQNDTLNITFNITCGDQFGGCNDVNLSLVYESTNIGESGSVTLSNFQSQAVSFTRTYDSTPVVIAVPVTDTDSDNNGLIPVISSISTTGFSISLCEDAGATTCSATVESEEVHYFVFDVDASNTYSWIDVGTVTGVASDGTGDAFTFGKTFTNTPYVFAWPQTDTDGGTAMAPSVWPVSITTSGASMIACDHPGTADACAGSTTETIGYVAIDPLLFDLANFEMGTESIGASTWTPITFTNTYTNTRLMVSQNEESGTQDPQYPWGNLVTGTGADIRYCEQDAAGVCDSHNPEVVRWFAHEGGLIELGSSTESLVNTTTGAIPFFTTSLNPQFFNLSANTSIVTNFTINATGGIEEVYNMLGILGNGVDTQTLAIRIIGQNILNWTLDNLTFDPVFQDENIDVETVGLYSRYTNNNVTFKCIAGDCGEFSTTWVNGTGTAEGATVTVSFICEDNNVGNFTALFNLSSNELPNTDQINLSCVVDVKPLDIDLHHPLPGITTNVPVHSFFNLTYNVTCQNASGCNNVLVTAAYEDLERHWWNLSWKHRINMTLNSSSATTGNYTFLIELNSTNVGKSFDWIDACNDIRFARNNSELGYWIEQCDFSAEVARIWVRSDIPLSSTELYQFEMYYGNDNVNTTSDGYSTFLFFEDFENYGGTSDGLLPPNWTNFGTGEIRLLTESNGNRVALKTANDDSNGGFVDFGTTVSDFEVIWKTNRNQDLSGTANRYAVSDNTASGYGAYTANYGASTAFILEERASGTATTLVSGSTFSTSQNTWYTKVLTYESTVINHSFYDDDFVRLNTLQTTDPTITSFTRFYIHGGQEFLTDDIALRVPLSTEPTLNILSEENNYIPISTLDTQTPFYTNSSNNPVTVNLTDNETLQVVFFVNATGNVGSYHYVLGALHNDDVTDLTIINITNIETGVNLSLIMEKTFISDNFYNVDMTLSNNANLPTPINSTIVVYTFISNNAVISFPVDTTTSASYTTNYTSETLNDPQYNGTIYHWNIMPNSFWNTTFNSYNGTRTTSDYWNLNFNLTLSGNYSFNDAIEIGFDPELFNNRPQNDQLEENSFLSFRSLIQIFINLFRGGIS